MKGIECVLYPTARESALAVTHVYTHEDTHSSVRACARVEIQNVQNVFCIRQRKKALLLSHKSTHIFTYMTICVTLPICSSCVRVCRNIECILCTYRMYILHLISNTDTHSMVRVCVCVCRIVRACVCAQRMYRLHFISNTVSQSIVCACIQNSLCVCVCIQNVQNAFYFSLQTPSSIDVTDVRRSIRSSCVSV